MVKTVRVSGVFTAASVSLLALSGSVPWMGAAHEARAIPAIGGYPFGHGLALVELIFLVLIAGVTGAGFALPDKRVTGGLLCALGVGYTVLSHSLVAKTAVSSPDVFEPVLVGPTLASVAGCLAVAAGALLLHDSVEAL